MKTAAIDIGTNTFLCLISEVRNGQIEIIDDYSRVVRLGEKVHQTRMFQAQALERAEKVLKEYKNYIDQHGIKKLKAIATSASRDVKNSHELISLCQKYSIPIEIISGEKEAYYTYVGACYDLQDKKRVFILDIGGGSTEVVQEKEQKISGQSVDVGAVRITEMFFTEDPPTDQQLLEAARFIKKEFEVFKGLQAQSLIAVAGTPTTLACMEQEIEYDSSLVHGFRLTDAALESWEKKLKSMDSQERKNIKGLEPGRADVILAGVLILRSAMGVLGVDHVMVSIRGARFGLALELAGEKR